MTSSSSAHNRTFNLQRTLNRAAPQQVDLDIEETPGLRESDDAFDSGRDESGVGSADTRSVRQPTQSVHDLWRVEFDDVQGRTQQAGDFGQ